MAHSRPPSDTPQAMPEASAAAIAFPASAEAIELRHLRTFVAVAEELNFGRAASRLYLSQPALSRQIRTLERVVGCELLRRSTHRVELTLAGDALLDRARAVLAAVDDAIATAQSVGGELNARIMKLWAPFLALASADTSIHAMRDVFEDVLAHAPMPPEIAVRPVTAGGVPALALGEDAAILYLHGGSFVLGSAYGYRPLVGALVAASRRGALVPDFRLAPEHPFPAALEDALAAYHWLVEQRGDASRVVLAGDSSGAGLALAVLLSLKNKSKPMPAGAALLCPGLDLSGELLTPTEAPNTMDEVVRAAAAYLGDHPIDDPLVSPLRGDLTGLPSLLIQYATGDRARPEAEALADRAHKHGVDARLDPYSAETHVFHVFWSFLPEAADALAQAGEFVRDVLPAQGRAAGRTG
jgi:epsilon-lactone hydrolase